MKKTALAVSVAMVSVAFLASCKDDDKGYDYSHTSAGGDGSGETSVTVLANEFVHDVMTTYYYWNTEMPNLDYKRQPDTQKYFYKLLSSKDRFSYISDDYKSVMDEFDGVTTAKGIQFKGMYWTSKGDSLVAVIEFVFPNTPASRAGLRRGDIIYSVDGKALTTSNFSDALQQKTATFGVWHYESDDVRTDNSVQVTSEKINEDYVPVHKVITTEAGTKVGYVLYMSYSAAYDAKLKSAISDLAAEGVTECVLDLRYNTGGDVSSLQYLCSMLAPQDVVSAKKEIMYYEFNKTLVSVWPQQFSRDSTQVLFVDTVGVNLNINRLYALVGGSTYSASEGTIWGLKPYMDVTLIGDTTGGKNSMMYVLSPADFVSTESGESYYSESINNWMLMPIVAVYNNSTGKTFDTSKGKGLAPDYAVRDLAGLTSGGVLELGDPKENLLSKALSLIDDKPAENKSCDVEENVRMLGSSAVTRRGGMRSRLR